jgi:hypothetical protein
MTDGVDWQGIERLLITGDWATLKLGLRNWWRGYLGLEYDDVQKDSPTVKRIIDNFTAELRRRRDAGVFN